MCESEYLVVFPLYVIVIPPKLSPVVCISESDDTIRGVALFTEELFAERSRDAQVPTGEIWKIESNEVLKGIHLPLFRKWGLKYLTIDPHPITGQSIFVPIEDLD